MQSVLVVKWFRLRLTRLGKQIQELINSHATVMLAFLEEIWPLVLHATQWQSLPEGGTSARVSSSLASACRMPLAGSTKSKKVWPLESQSPVHLKWRTQDSCCRLPSAGYGVRKYYRSTVGTSVASAYIKVVCNLHIICNRHNSHHKLVLRQLSVVESKWKTKKEYTAR